jgi:hypothetical protein
MLQHENERETQHANGQRGATTSPDVTPSTNPRASSIILSPSTEKPQSFGSWLMRIVSARPFM